jgi:hypothetical protein
MMGLPQTLTVCTFLWHDPGYRWNSHFIYGAEHVNKLYRAVHRNLRLPHEFVCITDIPAGIDPAIRIVRLWNDHRNLGGSYVRLRAFAADMRDVLGPRFAWLDLDCVITGNLDPVLGRSEDFIAWKDVAPPPRW